MPLKAVKWMMQDISPLYFDVRSFDANTIGWMMKMLAQCSPQAFSVNKERMLRVARYSAECFRELNAELKLDYDVRMKGTLEVFRSQSELDGAISDVAILERCNVPHAMVNVENCIRYEPALANVKEKIVGGLYLPGDGTGDCYKFTNGLATECRKLGVQFMMGTEIHSIETAKGKVSSLNTSAGELKADKYVLALAATRRTWHAELASIYRSIRSKVTP